MANFPFHMGWCLRTDRKVKDAKTRGRGLEKIKVRQPSAIATYNITKSGVDLADQYRSYVRPEFRSRRNMRSYFIGLLLTAVDNSRVISNKNDRLPYRNELSKNL